MHYTPVSPQQFADAGLADWRLADGVIRADFRAGSFPSAAALVPLIADAAEAVDHHPDIDVRYPDHVLVALTSHFINGLSTHDLDLARTISRLADEAGARAER